MIQWTNKECSVVSELFAYVCNEFDIRKCFWMAYLMLIKYWATATESGLPLIVMVRSVLPPSRSSQFDIRIMAPEIWRISAIFVPPFPMIQPIKSFGTVISCCCRFVCCWLRFWLLVRNWEPANAASAKCSQMKNTNETMRNQC